MKKKIFSLAAALVIIYVSYSAAFSLDLSAESAVLMCADTGEVLYEKNSLKKMSMASTTKIMTALITLEAGISSKEVIVTDEMVNVEGTSMGLLPGDSVSVRELVYGMLLQSGNDAANAAAIVVGGSPEGFAKMMNSRAKKIGMFNTNFVTASGLDDDDHYTTAYDMALLACESLKNPEFAAICSAKTAKLTYGSPPYERVLKNHNRLLWSYEDSIGIKTGFTKKSGRCLVSAAQRDGITLVAVTLRAPDDWNDHISLLETGFEMIVPEKMQCDLFNVRLKVCGGEQNEAKVRLSEEPAWIEEREYSYRIFLKQFEYAPVSEGDIVGCVKFYYNDCQVKESLLLADESVEIKENSINQTQEKKGFLKSIKTYISEFLSESGGEIFGGK